MEKSRSAVPEVRVAPTLQAEAIRQLFISLLREGHGIRSLAVGESMSPSIKKGELLIVTTLKDIYIQRETHTLRNRHPH